MNRLRHGWAFVLTMAAVTGCSSGRLCAQYDRFLQEPTQQNLKPLDSAGRQGASILVGLLALDASYALHDSPTHPYVHISYLEVHGSIQVDILRRTGRIWDRDSIQIEVPPTSHRLSLFVRNPYVVSWAREVQSKERLNLLAETAQRNPGQIDDARLREQR